MSETYRITATGDAAHTRDVTGTWDDLVAAVAAELRADPTDADRADARDMLENGIDSDGGWDGRCVHLSFEDGSLTVKRVRGDAPAAAPAGREAGQ